MRGTRGNGTDLAIAVDADIAGLVAALDRLGGAVVGVGRRLPADQSVKRDDDAGGALVEAEVLALAAALLVENVQVEAARLFRLVRVRLLAVANARVVCVFVSCQSTSSSHSFYQIPLRPHTSLPFLFFRVITCLCLLEDSL